MLLPANFTGIIADTFHDKTVTKLAKTASSTDGWIDESGTPISTFKANVRFGNLEEAQSDMGLTERIDVLITCGKDVDMQTGDLFAYDGIHYRAEVRQFDSHKKIAGRKWQQ